MILCMALEVEKVPWFPLSEVLHVYMAIHSPRLCKLGIAVLADERARLCVYTLVCENVRFLLEYLVATCHLTLIEALHSIRLAVQNPELLAHLDFCLVSGSALLNLL